MSHPSRCSLHHEEFAFGEHPRKPKFGMSNSESETRGDSMMILAAISCYSILLIPLLPFMAELLQGSTWTGSVIRCIPWSRRYFRTMMNFPKKIMPQFTQLELFGLALKNMKVNFSIIPGQQNDQIWTSLNQSGQFLRLDWGTHSHLKHL
jgi:hypothetical protein